MKKLLPYLIISSSVFFWGISFIFTKELFLTESSLSVTTLVTLRLAIATAIMMPFLLISRKLQHIKKGDLKWFLLLALCEPFIYHLCETSGVQLVSGSLASVVIATIPLFVPFGMWIAYRERIGTHLILGVVLSLVGVTIMLGGDLSSLSIHHSSLKGLLFLSGAVIIAVVYTILLLKVVDRYNALSITTWQNLFGLAYFLILSSFTSQFNTFHSLSWSPKMILLILSLGLFCSTIAYAGYNYAVRKLGASRACIFNNAIPIFSLIAAIIIGQESFSWLKLIGMIIVIAGVALSQKKSTV